MSLETIATKFALVEDRLAIRRSVVLFVTLWMSWRAFTWAAEFAHSVIVHNAGSDGALSAAALVAAVTAPIAYLQKSVFSAYIESKAATPTA